MGVDTVKLRSPSIDRGLAEFLEKQCILKQGIELSTGNILYELTNGSLEGSYDSRISFRVMYEEYINHNGRPELVPCDPYILAEASLHKIFHGQNVFGAPSDFRFSCWRFIDVLGVLLSDDPELLPSPDRWTVHRVDWAEVYRLSPRAIEEFFRGISHCKFPKRSKKSAKYGVNAVYFPGTTTTIKLYHKGPEFREHDVSRVRTALAKWRVAHYPKSENYDSNEVWVKRKLKALQRLADSRLRVEVEIHSEKLNFDFGDRNPLVSEVTDEYLKQLHDKELFKLLKEGKSEMETVRTHDAVKARLNFCYGKRSANNLFAFWMQLAARGEDVVKVEYSQSQFYSNRKKLIDVGVSWNSSNIFILPEDQLALPRDFLPVRADPRRCEAPVRNGSVFNVCPTVYRELKDLKLAA